MLPGFFNHLEGGCGVCGPFGSLAVWQADLGRFINQRPAQGSRPFACRKKGATLQRRAERTTHFQAVDRAALRSAWAFFMALRAAGFVVASIMGISFQGALLSGGGC